MSSDSPRRATDEQVNAAWIKVCEKADEWVERSGTESGFSSPQPGSSLAGDDARSAGYLVSHAGRHNFSQSIDCLHAVVSLVRDLGVLHPAALGNLLRGALETTSVALWVLSPPQRQERLARTLRWHVKNVKDGETAFAGAGISRSSTRLERLERVKAAGESAGIDWDDIRGGYTSTEAVETAHTFLENPLGVTLPWRLCSGFAHGRPWASLGFLELEQRETSDPSLIQLKMTTSLDRTLYLAWAAMTATNRAIALFEGRATNHLNG